MNPNEIVGDVEEEEYEIEGEEDFVDVLKACDEDVAQMMKGINSYMNGSQLSYNFGLEE